MDSWENFQTRFKSVWKLRTGNLKKTMTMEEDSLAKEGASGLELKIQHKVLPTSQYCNHMMVQGDEECVYLHFFQIRPPIILDSMADSEKPTTVVAEPIICLAVDIAKMERFVAVMTEQVNRMKEKTDVAGDS